MSLDSSAGHTFDVGRIDSQLKKWRERLLDLTRKNPLLGINRSRVSKLRVSRPTSQTLFASIAGEDQTLKMPLVRREAQHHGSDDPTDENQEAEPKYIVDPGDVEFDASPKEIGRLLRRIYDNARTTVEERGVTTLHLTFGTLDWDDPILGDSSSPLLLVPCELKSLGPNAHLRLSMLDEEIQVNPALDLYLRERHHIQLPDFAEEPTAESLLFFLDRVRASVTEQAWAVEVRTWLSTFSFESLVIYNDLVAMAETARTNPIVAAFARAGNVRVESEALGDDLDELEVPDIVPIPVLPADASQLMALATANAGRHLVVHGPPGTGKSQTITNLIADALGRGKTVLFVSAKMAALDVVYKRLRSLGLGRFCLEAHSTKAGKAKIIEELKRTLDLPSRGSERDLGEQLDELKHIRQRLNEYVKEIHRRREPLGMTVYQAVGAWEHLSKLPAIDFDLPWTDVLTVDRTELRDVGELLEDIQTQAPVFGLRKTHPWRGYSVVSDQPLNADFVRRNLKATAGALHQVQQDLALLAQLISPAKDNFSLADIELLSSALDLIAECRALPSGWTKEEPQELFASERLCQMGHDKAEQYRISKDDFDKISLLSPTQLRTQLEPLEGDFSSWTRLFKPRFWKWQAATRTCLSATADHEYSALRSYLELSRAAEAIEDWFTTEGGQLSRYVSNPISDPAALADMALAFKLAQLLRSAMVDEIISQPSDEGMIEDVMRSAARTILGMLRSDVLRDAVVFNDTHWPAGFCGSAPISLSPVDAASVRCQQLLDAMPRLHEWTALQSVVDRCRDKGLSSFLDALGESEASHARSVFERAFLERWVESVLDCSPVLREFTGPAREEQVRRFAESDRAVQAATLKHIQSVAGAPASNVASANEDFGESGEVGVLRRELQKRKRIKPLRRLFAEIPHVLRAIKPCMLMSPVSVSTFLKPDGITFDLVVFDEASQLPTPEAIPSILRAKQVVVAGDENQLPPTTFFRAASIFEAEESDESDEDLEPLESLLDDCVAVKPVFAPAKIVWHYRSKDERLIKFSNHYFYNNALITFPSASAEDNGCGVRLVYAPDGVWDRGRSKTNRVEARRVAELVLEHLGSTPERSLGVVAMNATQKEAIEYALDDLIADQPELMPLLDASRDAPFFVKSLENVQGDERDTIMISVGYGKTADGALSMNFGPLNREGGWRRLNVLVTRAKWQTVLVTSLRSQELSAVNPDNKGALMLRSFIEYAERGATLPPDPVVVSESETNDFEDSVAEALRDRGLIVDEQVGASRYRIDLAVRDRRNINKYVMGIECDGATYHSTRTARDRDILRQEVLRAQGWRIYRLWSTDWFRDREKALQNILKYVALAQQSTEERFVPPKPSLVERAEGECLQSDEGESADKEDRSRNGVGRRFEAGMPYVKHRPPRDRGSKVLSLPHYVRQLGDAIAETVRVESPIHESLLIERLKENLGVSRAGSNIIRNIEQALRFAIRNHGLVRTAGGFIYKDLIRPQGFRTHSSSMDRSLDQIAPEEIENAILYLVEDQFGFAKDGLSKAVQDLFGIAHVRGEKVETIHRAVDRLLDGGRLRLSGFTLYLA